MSKKVCHTDAVAIRKAAIDGWEPFAWEVIGTDGMLITGGIPRLLTRGPRKGKKTWARSASSKVVVTRVEVDAEEARYVAETGNCGKCYGIGRVMVGWSATEGEKYSACKACDGKGAKCSSTAADSMVSAAPLNKAGSEVGNV